MAENYIPQHPMARANHPPEPLQEAPYVMADGTILPCIIHQVFNHSEDGKYYSVSVTIIWPPEIGPTGSEHPGEVLRSGKAYQVSTGQVLSSTCGPPWPG